MENFVFVFLGLLLCVFIIVLHLFIESESKKILDDLTDGYYYILDGWDLIYHEIFSWKSICCMTCDFFNCFFGLFIFSLLMLVFAMIIAVLLRNLIFFLFLSAFLLIILIFGSFTIRIKTGNLLVKSYQQSIEHPQSDDLSENDKHIAIIFPHYSSLKDELVIGDCISLLIDGFNKTHKKYKIYNIYKKSNFEEAYYHKNVDELWIIGHGTHGIFGFGKKDENDRIVYSDLKPVDPPKIIYQLHCNNGNMESLWDRNKNGGFVSKYKRTFYHNRCYILQKFKNK